jgi:hypothetical protein
MQVLSLIKNMAVAIITTSATLEGQVLEVLNAYHNAENTYNIANPSDQVNFLQFSINADTKILNASIQFPVNLTTTAEGITVSASRNI